MPGSLNTTRHSQVVEAITHRRSRGIRQGSAGGNLIDETGTVDISAVLQEEQQDQEARRVERRECAGLHKSLVETHGIRLGTKQEGVCRLMYENINGLPSHITGNGRLDKAKKLIDEFQPDIVAYNEVRINWKHRQVVHGLGKMFQGGGTEVRAVTGHNVHENISKTQEGGTALLAYGWILDHLDSGEVQRDELNLGRWVVMTFRGANELRTRVLCGYNPCYNRSKVPNGTVYQQQARHLITVRKNMTCPRTQFRHDLHTLLTGWRAAGDRIIVCMDVNENIYKKSLGKLLSDPEGLDMKEVVGDFTGSPLGATHFRGSTPIDGIWATRDIEVVGACVMPCGFGVGDHRLFLVDFRSDTIVGQTPVKIVRPSARRLNTRLPFVAEKYSTRLKTNIIRHRLLEKLETIGEECPPDDEAAIQINKIDKESKKLMVNAERKCRKIRAGTIPFTPETAAMIRRLRVFQSLLRFRLGHKANLGNLVRTARRHNVENPLSLSIEGIRIRIKACNDELSAAKVTGWADRRKSLLQCAQDSRTRGDDTAAEQILDIIQREKDRSFWRKMKYIMGKQHGRSVSMVQVEEAGSIVEHTTQESVQSAIWEEIHKKRFYLAEAAPICKGDLRGEFGYLSVSPTAKRILDGNYVFPDYFDDDTIAICRECARIRSIIPLNAVSDEITEEDWRKWRRSKEDTSSSESGLHFGHYKASTKEIILAQFHALKSSLVLKHGVVLDRWSRGLSVMLEKMFGCTLISKLRSILLMEADFNFVNKQIYGIRMLDEVRKYKLMPDEIFSERNRMAEDGTLAKTLFYDISRQSRRPAGLASVDAESCYDRIAHAVASLVFQSFGVPSKSVVAMLKTIQDMKFFLRTAYGDSADFATSSVEIKSQGLCQGNGAAPAGWTVISITLLNAHKERGHSAIFHTPVSARHGNIAAIIYVDDTDLLHIDLDEQETLEETHWALQESMISWGRLLLASGGSLKPEKCFAYLWDFDYSDDGEWAYSAEAEDEKYDLIIPLTDGGSSSIERLGVDDARKTLGYWTTPSGNAEVSIQRMKEGAQGWIDKAKEGGLHRRYIWKMMDIQLWPRIGFGMCNNLASLPTLQTCLLKEYYNLLPLGGVVRSAPKGLRQLAPGFYGVGCPHPAIECVIAQLNKLLMHYGCSSGLALQLQTSMEYMIIELGMSGQPFLVNFEKFGDLVTHCWMKTVWEKCHYYGIRVEIGNLDMGPPRKGDKWLMQAFTELGFNGKELRQLNRVRLFQQVLYLSDILEAGGRYVDEAYITPRPYGETRSIYTFPKEHPAQADFDLWKYAIQQLAPGGRVAIGLREVCEAGHKVWRWRLDEVDELLVRIREDGIYEGYRRSELPGHANRPNRWSISIEEEVTVLPSNICSVRELSDGVWGVRGVTRAAPAPLPVYEWMDLLYDWGELWMWDNLTVEGDSAWILESIKNGDCMAVTDGSYMEDVDSSLCSAAFIFECKKGRGRIHGSFCERSTVACAYRGELLGLLAIHLILLSVDTVGEGLEGTLDVYSDCMTAIWTIGNLPPTMIPARFKHADILKVLLIKCAHLSDHRRLIHVPAHQDDDEDFDLLSRSSQLNCIMDHRAKQILLANQYNSLGKAYTLPLEAITVTVGKDKVTSASGPLVRYWCHRRQAKDFYTEKHILYPQEFNSLDWESIHGALTKVPRLFQIWACKQVMNIAGTFGFRSKYEEGIDPFCPSCTTEKETCSHILSCQEAGRVQALLSSIEVLEEWLEEMGTDPLLSAGIIHYASGRGGVSLEEFYYGSSGEYRRLGRAQDRVGWRRFMEGMVVGNFRVIQCNHRNKERNLRDNSKTWASELVIRLLECAHGQWIYRNVVVHDRNCGTIQTARKEQIREELRKHMEAGDSSLDEEDQYLLDIDFRDLETTDGAQQEYWLRAIEAARVAKQLRAAEQDEPTQGIG